MRNKFFISWKMTSRLMLLNWMSLFNLILIVEILIDLFLFALLISSVSNKKRLMVVLHISSFPFLENAFKPDCVSEYGIFKIRVLKKLNDFEITFLEIDNLV